MRDTVSNLANLMMGQVGKNIAANQKKVKNRLAKALPAGQSPTEASGTQGESKSKRRNSALQAQISKQKGSSALPTPDAGQQMATTNETPQAAPFHLVLLMVSGQGQAEEAKPPSDAHSTKESSDDSSIQAISPNSNLVGQSLLVAQVQTAPAGKTDKAGTKSRSEALTPAPEQTKSKDPAVQQDPQQTVGQAPEDAIQADLPQQAGVQAKQPVQAVDAAAAQVTPLPSAAPAPSAAVLTDVSQQQVPQVSGQRVQQGKEQPGTANSAAISQDVPAASLATAVSEAPSVKSSVVASGGANKQTVLSSSPSAGGVSASAFQTVATQVLANADAAQASTLSAPVVAAASHGMDSSLTGQIARAVASVGPGNLGHQMVIQLNPPELGRVRLTLESKGDQIRGVLRVDDPGTLTQLRGESPALLHRLSENGLDVRQMDILPSHPGSSQSQAFGQGQDGQAARQQQSSPWRDASPAPSPQTTFSQTTPADDVQYVGAGSINTLA